MRERRNRKHSNALFARLYNIMYVNRERALIVHGKYKTDISSGTRSTSNSSNDSRENFVFSFIFPTRTHKTMTTDGDELHSKNIRTTNRTYNSLTNSDEKWRWRRRRRQRHRRTTTTTSRREKTNSHIHTHTHSHAHAERMEMAHRHVPIRSLLKYLHAQAARDACVRWSFSLSAFLARAHINWR